MGQLRVQQADGVAPRAESARPILYASFPRYLGDFVLWNKIANLAQKVKPTTCWFDCFFLFHPCRVAGSKRQANTFFHFLWDGCDRIKWTDFLRPAHTIHSRTSVRRASKSGLQCQRDVGLRSKHA